jgi:hypothetical protein
MSDTHLPMFEDLPKDNVVAIEPKRRKARKAKKTAKKRRAYEPEKPDRGAAIRLGIARAKKAKKKARAAMPRRGRVPGKIYTSRPGRTYKSRAPREVPTPTILSERDTTMLRVIAAIKELTVEDRRWVLTTIGEIFA